MSLGDWIGVALCGVGIALRLWSGDGPHTQFRYAAAYDLSGYVAALGVGMLLGQLVR